MWKIIVGKVKSIEWVGFANLKRGVRYSYLVTKKSYTEAYVLDMHLESS